VRQLQDTLGNLANQLWVLQVVGSNPAAPTNKTSHFSARWHAVRGWRFSLQEWLTSFEPAERFSWKARGRFAFGGPLECRLPSLGTRGCTWDLRAVTVPVDRLHRTGRRR
jgi:hypothetical protein